MIVLASASPRRRELLEIITGDFLVCVPNTDERTDPGLAPAEAVMEIALRKARKAAEAYPSRTVVGADTAVVLDGEMLGKPRDANAARAMLERLSGREHLVYTGVAVLAPGGDRVFAEETAVRFRRLSGAEIARYVDSGEPMDKAGAYGIQGGGALFVQGIRGDYYNVVGLPLCALNRVLEDLAEKNGNL